MLRVKGRVGSKWAKFTTLFIVVVLAALLVSPTGCYLSRAAWEQGKILSGRKQIVDIMSDKRVDSVTKQKLRVVSDARRYAIDVLNLKAGDSYTMYSDVGRDTLLLVLSAAYKDRLERYTWWFPIVGTVPYKGFFDFTAARKAADDLDRKGYDTYLRPADAFSTLGFFNDPLLNTTLQADSLTLANTVIHEITHNTFYASGQATFNESFASFVGARGAADFFRRRGQERMVRIAESRWEDQKRLGDFWTELSEKLESAFRMYPQDSLLRLEARNTIYDSARLQLRDSLMPLLSTYPENYPDYVRLDNAALLARRVYSMQLGLFDEVWEAEGRDLNRAIRRLVQLAKQGGKDPFTEVRNWVDQERIRQKSATPVRQ